MSVSKDFTSLTWFPQEKNTAVTKITRVFLIIFILIYLIFINVTVLIIDVFTPILFSSPTTS